MPNYYGTPTANTAKPTSNTLIANSADASYSVRLTTGDDNKLIIDISGAATGSALSDASCIRIRCVVNDGETNGFDLFTTNVFQYKDISSVVGGTGVNDKNEGQFLVDSKGDDINTPFTFRTLQEDSADPGRAFRVVLKPDATKNYIKNGDKVNVYVDACNNATSTAFLEQGFKISKADVSFNQATNTPPYALINDGPSGSLDKKGIPPFSAKLLKKGQSSTDAVIQVSSGNISLFADGGEGIELKKMIFVLAPQNVDGTPGGDDYYFTLLDTSEKVVDGVYLYEADVTGGANKSYRIQCERVADEFDVTADVNQSDEFGELLLIDNRPVNPVFTGTSITVDGTHPGEGKKAVVSFKGAGAPEGYKTIERYSAYYASRDQIDAMPNKSVKLENFKANVPTQVVHIDRADIDYTAQDSGQKITITGLANTRINDNGSRYAVLVTASTKDKSGTYLESNNIADVPAANFTTSVDASMGFRVSGTPDAPGYVSVKTGKSILTTGETTNNDTMFNLLDNNLDVIYFDNVEQNGEAATGVSYAIIRQSDVKYVGANDFTLDASFTDVTQAFSGKNDGLTRTIDATNSAGIKYIYQNGKWDDVTNGLKDASNGSQFALKFALKNSTGVGAKSDWVNFTPSATPNAQDALFAFDPSGDDNTAAFGNFDTAANVDWQLDQADINSAARAAAQGLTIDSTGIAFKWSLKSKTEKAKGPAGIVNETLDGGSAITSSRFTVVRSTTNVTNESSAMRAARIYGQSQQDIDFAKSGDFAQVGTTERIFASEGKDSNDNTVSMKMGQRYDISATLVNANGFNTDKKIKCVGFAPMGTLSAPKNVKQGTKAPYLSGKKAVVDISCDDLSGAELGGHLLTAYDVKMTQNVNGVINTIQNFATSNDKKRLDGSNNGIIGTSNLARQFQFTTEGDATAGYPITVTLRAEANARAYNNVTNNTNKAEAVNKSYNKNQASVTSETVINIAGPTMVSGSEHDEIQGLTVKPADKALTIAFSTPQNAAVIDLTKNNGNDPRVLSYQVTTWDISQTTIASAGVEVLAVNKYEKTIPHVSSPKNQTEYSVTQDGLVNGCAYLVQVRTLWGYGAQYTQQFTTVGMYSSTPNKGTITDVPKAVSGGYRWYSAGANAENLTNPIKSASSAPSGTGSMHLPVSNGNYHVPSTKPTITNDRANSVLTIRDNGAPLTNGALIQIGPTATGSGTSVFNVDLLAASGGTPTHYTTAPAFKDNIDKTYTIKSGTLGTGWAEERNIIIVENSNGAAWEIQQP